MQISAYFIHICKCPLYNRHDKYLCISTIYVFGEFHLVTGGALITNNSEIRDNVKTFQSKYGSFLPPFESYLLNRSLKTLPLRMQKHSENGLAVAKYLETNPNVVKVIHPGLPSHPQFEYVKKVTSGYCGIVTFEIKGGVDEATKFIQNLKVFQSSGSLGTAMSFVMIS